MTPRLMGRSFAGSDRAGRSGDSGSPAGMPALPGSSDAGSGAEDGGGWGGLSDSLESEVALELWVLLVAPACSLRLGSCFFQFSLLGFVLWFCDPFSFGISCESVEYSLTCPPGTLSHPLGEGRISERRMRTQWRNEDGARRPTSREWMTSGMAEQELCPTCQHCVRRACEFCVCSCSGVSARFFRSLRKPGNLKCFRSFRKSTQKPEFPEFPE